ncbi:MAG: DUF4389 domain-containing protein [Candidatus Pacearchaeota archaeon]|jgi:hypothetical protein
MVDNKKKEKKEAWMRIFVLIVTGIILGVWKSLNVVLFIVNWFIVVFKGKRNQGIAEFCEIWNTQSYDFFRYMTFVTNKRPFPFESLKPNMTKFEK